MKPVMVSYVATFCKREMLHVHRQVSGIHSWRNIVATRRRENADRFPYLECVELRRSPWRWIGGTWNRLLKRRANLPCYENRQLLGLVREQKAQLVHIYFGTEAARVIPFLSKVPVPRVVSFHGADVSTQLTDAELKTVVASCDLMLCRSNSLRETLVARGVNRNRIQINYTGVPVPEACPPREETDFRTRPVRLLQASRFLEKKGLDLSINATALLEGKGIPTILTLAGDGPLTESLRALAARLGIEHRVRFLGFLNQEELSEQWAANDFFLHPSRTGTGGDSEGIPNSILEAMAQGVPVIASHHGGIPEAIEDGISGFLVSGATAMAESIASLVKPENAARYQQLRVAGWERARDLFSPEASIRALEGIYGSLV